MESSIWYSYLLYAGVWWRWMGALIGQKQQWSLWEMVDEAQNDASSLHKAWDEQVKPMMACWEGGSIWSKAGTISWNDIYVSNVCNHARVETTHTHTHTHAGKHMRCSLLPLPQLEPSIHRDSLPTLHLMREERRHIFFFSCGSKLTHISNTEHWCLLSLISVISSILI